MPFTRSIRCTLQYYYYLLHYYFCQDSSISQAIKKSTHAHTFENQQAPVKLHITLLCHVLHWPVNAFWEELCLQIYKVVLFVVDKNAAAFVIALLLNNNRIKPAAAAALPSAVLSDTANLKFEIEIKREKKGTARRTANK